MGFSGGGGGGLNGVTVSGTPSIGQILEALSTSTAGWVTGGGGPPTGAAGGDLSGTYPSPVVAKVNGAALPLGLVNGGTGQGNAQAAINALLGGVVTAGNYPRGNGTNVVMAGIQVGDVPTLNQSTTGNAATATAAAGLESATTTVAVSGATAPTAGQVLTATSGTAANWASPSGGTAEYLAIHQYAPVALAQPNCTTATLAAFDSTNINTGNFIAPASGAVIVRVHAVLNLLAGGTAFALAAHGTVTPVVANEILLTSPANQPFQYADLTFYVTGLTPGNTYNFDLLGASSNPPTPSAQFNILAITATTPTFTGTSNAGPLLVTVETAI